MSTSTRTLSSAGSIGLPELPELPELPDSSYYTSGSLGTSGVSRSSLPSLRPDVSTSYNPATPTSGSISNTIKMRNTKAPNYSNSYDPLNNKIIYGNKVQNLQGQKGADGTSLRGTPLGRYGYGSMVFMIVFTFVISVIFAPLSYGFLYFILFWAAWVFIYSVMVNFQYPTLRIFYVVGIFAVGLLGFIIGRVLLGKESVFGKHFED